MSGPEVHAKITDEKYHVDCGSLEYSQKADTKHHFDPVVDDKILDLSRTYIENIHQSQSTITGYIDGKEKLDEFLSMFKLLCSNTFPVRDSKGWCKLKQKGEIISDKTKLYWQLRSSIMPVPCFFMPFVVEGYLIRHCINGEMSYKTKQNIQRKTGARNQEELSVSTEGLPLEPPKKQCRSSKKFGCPASIKIKQITIFPEFKINPAKVKSAKGLRKLKENQLIKCRRVLRDENLTCLTRFCIEIPLTGAHSHPTLSKSILSGFNFIVINKLIIKKIQELVQVGVVNVDEIKHQLKILVNAELSKPNCIEDVEIDEEEYVPSDSEIKKHVKATLKHCSDTTDKQKALIKELQHIAAWACKSTDAHELNVLLEKVTSISKDLSLDDSSSLVQDMSDVSHEFPVAYSNGEPLLMIPEQTDLQTMEPQRELLINIPHNTSDMYVAKSHMFVVESDAAENHVHHTNITDSSMMGSQQQSMLANDYIISTVEVGADETANVGGDILYTVVENNGQVYLQSSR